MGQYTEGVCVGGLTCRSKNNLSTIIVKSFSVDKEDCDQALVPCTSPVPCTIPVPGASPVIGLLL